MMDTFNFNDALQLMGIGMLTVFLILFLVVFLGSIIIRFVNRFVPEVVVISATNRSKTTSQTIDSKTMAVIVAAVKTATHGKGNLDKVEKV